MRKTPAKAITVVDEPQSFTRIREHPYPPRAANGRVAGTAPDAEPSSRALHHECAAQIRCPDCGGLVELRDVRVAVTIRPPASEHAPGPTIEVPLDSDDSLDEVITGVKRRLVVRALRRAGGVKTRAAELVGIKYTTFYNLVERLDITDEEIFGATAQRC